MPTDPVAWLLWIFGGDTPHHPLAIGQVVMRATALYFIGLILVRIGKSRLLSRASAIDVILAILLGSLLSRGITGSASISATATAVVTLILIHFLLTAWSWHNHRISTLMKGHQRLLIKDGRIDLDKLRLSHITYDDLMEELRLNANCNDVSEVEVAYKERSGQVGVVLQKKKPQIIDISVVDGVQTVRIKLIH